MSITFRVTTDDDTTAVPPTQITIRQLVAFRSFAREHRMLVDDLDRDDDMADMPSFEVSICGFALAVLAKIFDMSEAVIAVIDEAQFRQRQIRFYKSEATGEIMVALSGTIDGSIDLDLANANAFEVLEALDLEAETTGTVTLAVFRARLGDPVVRRRFTVRRIDHYLARLDRLAGIAAHEQEPQLAWA